MSEPIVEFLPSIRKNRWIRFDIFNEDDEASHCENNQQVGQRNKRNKNSKRSRSNIFWIRVKRICVTNQQETTNRNK